MYGMKIRVNALVPIVVCKCKCTVIVGVLLSIFSKKRNSWFTDGGMCEDELLCECLHSFIYSNCWER